MSTAETPNAILQHESTYACLQALNSCHRAYVSFQYHNSADVERLSLPLCSPIEPAPDIVARFAEEAASSLSPVELSQLIRFLQHAPLQSQVAKLQQKGLEKRLESYLHEFYTEETKASGETKDRLARPGGPADADIGLILHIQSEDEKIGTFWDTRSATISLLQDKGFSESFVFGFDWHWRADGSFQGTSGCPTSKWKTGLRTIHDKFSAQLLDLLPLPFVVTGSSCSRERLRRQLSPRARTLKIILVPPIGVLQFDLDFYKDGIRRIIAHVHHPVAGFFVGPSTRTAMAAQMDAGLNFMLWLIGRPFKPEVFGQQYSTPRPPRSYQIAPLAEMWAYVREERDDQLLKVADYQPSFLRWAGRYLDQDPTDIIARGESVAGNAALQIRKRMSIARRNRPHHPTPNQSSSEQLRSSQITGITIPIPTDELIEPNQVEKIRNEVRQLSLAQPCVMEDLHNTIASITPSGRVSIGSKSANVLRFRMGEKAAQDILDSVTNVRVHLTGKSLQLKDNDKVLYTKPYERLLASAQGAEWLVQIVHQQAVARNQASEKPHFSASEGPHTIVVTPHNASLGAHWKNPELRNRLLHGDTFNCTSSLHQGNPSYRIYFRGITFYVPQEADPDTVFVQCFLAPSGSTHKFKCVEGGKYEDPAQRLGVQLSYADALSKERKQTWLRQRGDRNVCKVNSLVDFLEEKPLDWTETQPRRFLDRNIARGRLHVAYTPGQGPQI